ncbi:endoglucanase G-like [Ptychodera flava]|uniref:endoglucanase G-like n=1 Tax=Ptychodera flava TaxID=63121 RepID=UPI00396A4966
MDKILVLSVAGLFLSALLRIGDCQYERPPPDIPDIDEDEDELDLDSDDFRKKRSANVYDYDLAIHNSILFYEAQRSGKLPANNRISWRGDSAMDDKGLKGENLTGGWYDAGDHMKFNLPMAFATTMLAWGTIEFEDAYRSAGELDNVRDSIKWTCDYFIKCHTGPDEYYYQVGDPSKDHSYWGRPEEMTMERPAYKCDPTVPCSDVAAETAAALTACSIVFKDVDSEYSDKCISHARDLYKFAVKYPGKYPLQSYYRSNTYWDEIAWASCWLYKATKEENYLSDSQNYFATKRLKFRAYAFGWGDKKPGVQLMLYLLTNDEQYLKRYKRYVDCWLTGSRLPYTPKGLVMRNNWGSNRYAANTAAIALIASKYGVEPVDEYVSWAKSQIDYILGDGGHSFMVGFGENPPQRPHHRSSSCPPPGEPCNNRNSFKYDGPNHNELTGAIVGGVDGDDWWTDNRRDYVQNEVACDYNAGFQTATAGLIYFRNNGHPAF